MIALVDGDGRFEAVGAVVDEHDFGDAREVQALAVLAIEYETEACFDLMGG